MILPSILILIGAFDVKKRSEAFFSTMSLKSGRVFSTKLRPVAAPPVASLSTLSPPGFVVSRSVDDMDLLLFLEDLERTRLVEVRLVRALALELDAQADLVLRVGVAERLLVGDDTGLVQLVERLVEGLHAEPVRLGHDFLDGRNFAAEDQVGDQRRVEHDLHRGDAALAGF